MVTLVRRDDAWPLMSVGGLGDVGFGFGGLGGLGGGVWARAAATVCWAWAAEMRGRTGGGGASARPRKAFHAHHTYRPVVGSSWNRALWIGVR